MLEDGKIVDMGSYEHLLKHCQAFKNFMESYLMEKEAQKPKDDEKKVIVKEKKQKRPEKTEGTKKDVHKTEGKLIEKEINKSGNVCNSRSY